MDSKSLTGKVMTVRGPIEPDQLGTTLMHEHLFLALVRTAAIDQYTSATDYVLKDQKLTLENLHLARAWKPIVDNWILADVPLAIKEATEFRDMGGNTIVDVSNIGLRRDPIALRKVANATGLNIVMGSGWYHKAYHTEDIHRRTVDDLASEIVRDITVGVGETGVRSGIIGEIGVEGGPIEAGEEKSIRASVRASRATGAPISLHFGGHGKEKLKTIGIMGEEGVDFSKVIFGHSDMIAGDMPLMLELLEHGVYLEFDLLGKVGVPLEFQPKNFGPTNQPLSYHYALSALIAETVPKLIEAGHVDRVLLSHDVCTKIQLKQFGGTGYSFVLETFLPHLRRQGVADEDLHTIMVENPKRLLTLSEPDPEAIKE